MSEARPDVETAKNAAWTAKEMAGTLLYVLGVLVIGTGWTAFWVMVARFRFVQGATISAGFVVAVFVAPGVVATAWYLAELFDVDVPVPGPDVDLSAANW